jgi:riboflavin biosynthesis pyrimidine reductase
MIDHLVTFRRPQGRDNPVDVGPAEPVSPQATVPDVRQYLPEPLERIDVLEALWAERRVAPPGRPWILANMVASLDGAATVAGRSGALGGPADREVFLAMRSLADVVLVGASTVRAERYGPIRLDDRATAMRVAARRGPGRIAVVSASLDLDEDLPLFEDDPPPVVVTHAGADPSRRAALAARAEVLDAGTTSVDPAHLVTALADLGASVVLCEGGPTLLGQLQAADLIDEWCVTLAPVSVAGNAPRIAHSASETTCDLHLDRVWEADGALFLRHLRNPT